MHLPHGVQDLQYARPRVGLGLDAVGVTGVERSLRLGDGQRCLAQIDASVDLSASHMGVHMSRFHELFAEAVDDVLDDEAAGIERLAEHVARRLVERQHAARASVRIRTRLELADRTPASDLVTHETVELLGLACVGAAGTRRAIGVEATGINACPCAQGLVRARAEQRLADAGYSDEQVEEVLALVPIATHNQRGTGTLVVGTESTIDAGDLVALVHGAMSARIHELLKRPDELHVVEHAHANPRFVEDSVREMLAASLESTALDLADGDLVVARQVNHESIHAHDVFAERTALVGDLRSELAGQSNGPAPRALTLDAWLRGH